MHAGSTVTAAGSGASEQTFALRVERAFSVLRGVIRGAGLALVFALAAADYARTLVCRPRLGSLRIRALWLQRWSRIVSRLIGLKLHYRGAPPCTGMIVSNHLSYLDILAYSALVPCVFVAKQEVASWPVLGMFARMAGTIFVDRARRMEVAGANLRIAEVLRAGAIVLLFAEGTSSDGRKVLPFRSSLLEPVALSRCAVTSAAIGFHLDHGSVPEEVCYWRDMTLLPHLLNVLTKPAVRGQIAFGQPQWNAVPFCRKDLARRLRNEVSALAS